MLETITHGEITELKMNRPPANALNHELIKALLGGYDRALADGAQGVILSGQAGMFCAGIDVPELLGQDRSSIHAFWSLLFRFSQMLATSPVPNVAALTGHSPAGGAVLAAHCDYRIAIGGSHKIGFNEVQVGLPLPSTIIVAFEGLVGSRVARQLGTRGQLVEMDEALRIGLVDELVPAESLTGRALEWLRSLLALPPVAMNRTRLTSKARLIAALDLSNDVETVTEDWFSEETQAAMQRLVDGLKKI
jgi:enoyl-CoA hydratase/carnithine racemase